MSFIACDNDKKNILKYPIHYRYQASEEKGEYKKVKLISPFIELVSNDRGYLNKVLLFTGKTIKFIF